MTRLQKVRLSMAIIRLDIFTCRSFMLILPDPNGAKCSEDVAREIEKLKAENVEGIIMDLRGNGGGSLPEVVKMVGLFIEDGPVCVVKGRGEDKPIPMER